MIVVIRISTDNTMAKQMIYKTPHNTKDWATRTPQKTEVNSGVPERQPAPVPLVAPVVLMLNDTKIIWYGNRVGHQFTIINTNNINKAWTPTKQMRVNAIQSG
jgi:hypothetical protein